jgi:hypothetical protein
MHYQETKIKVLECSIDKLVKTIESKYGIAWLWNLSFQSSTDRILLTRYVDSLNELQNELDTIPHHVTDNISCPE